jgi:hypothetical protein
MGPPLATRETASEEPPRGHPRFTSARTTAWEHRGRHPNARPTPTTCRISTRDPEARDSVGCSTDDGHCAREVRLLARFHPASPARRETWRGAFALLRILALALPRNGSDAELVVTPQREAVLAHRVDASRTSLASVLGLLEQKENIQTLRLPIFKGAISRGYQGGTVV